MKKILCILMACLMMFVGTVIVMAKEENMVQLHSCDGPMGNFAVDTTNKVEGSASLSHTFTSGTKSFTNQVKFAPIDASGCDAIAFELYVSDPEIFKNMTQLCLEITSSGTCDHQENAWHSLQTVFGAREMKQGWNTIYLYVEESTLTDGKCDLSAINYLRIFAEFDGNALQGESLKFDNIRMLYTGGVMYDFEEMEYYLGDNPTLDIQIDEMSEPDLSNRHAGLTISSGLAE